MVDFVSYCIVMWFALIRIIRTKQQEGRWVEMAGTEHLKTEPDKPMLRNAPRFIRNFTDDLFGRKGDVLWDTS